MDYPLVIAQLRTLVPAFELRVAGAADFATGVEQNVWMALPAAYVLPLDDEADANDEQNGYRQLVSERVGVVVEFDNTVDRRAQGVTVRYEAMRSALFRALLNWNPDPERAARGFTYAGGRLLQFDRARLFYQFDFALEIVIDGLDDGWEQPSEPLEIITANAAVSDPFVPARADLPQE